MQFAFKVVFKYLKSLTELTKLLPGFLFPQSWRSPFQRRQQGHGLVWTCLSSQGTCCLKYQIKNVTSNPSYICLQQQSRFDDRTAGALRSNQYRFSSLHIRGSYVPEYQPAFWAQMRLIQAKNSSFLSLFTVFAAVNTASNLL